MYKNSLQYQSTPQLQQSSAHNTQQNKYGNVKQDQQKIQSKNSMNQQESDDRSIKENFQPLTCNSQRFKNTNNNQYQQQLQYDQEDESEYNNQGNNFLLNHTFSEDSNNDNSQVAYSSENKENSNVNLHINQQIGKQYETENDKNNIQNQQYEYQYKKQQSTKELKSEEKNSIKKRVLAIITLDVGGGNSDVIQVIEGDDLQNLAKNFCRKHKLNDNCIQYIIKNIQAQLDKRKPKKKENQSDLNDNLSQNINLINKVNQNLETAGKNSNIRESNESPKFSYLQQSLQGSLQSNQNINSQGLKQNGAFKQIHYNHSAFIQEENARKQRPQQPSFGQNQFFEQNSPQKQINMFEQINEEDQEDQSIGLIGQSANVSLPDENYEYQSTNRYQVKQQQKNQISLSNQKFEQNGISQIMKNNFLSPQQNFKIGAQMFSSPQSTQIGSQFTQNSGSNMQSLKSPNQLFQNSSIKKDNISDNQSANSNIYNYQEDQDEFLDIEDETSKHKQLYFDSESFDDDIDNQQFNSNQQKQQLLKNNKNSKIIEGQNQILKQQQSNTNIIVNNQRLQNSIGNQLSPSQKPSLLISEKSQKEDYQSDQQRIKMLLKQDTSDMNDVQNISDIQNKSYDYNYEQKQKIIQQIAEKLNIQQPKKTLQQPPFQQSSNTYKQQKSNQVDNSHAKKQSKDLNSNQQRQLDIKKEQHLIYQYSQQDQIHQYKNSNEQDYNFGMENQNKNQINLDSPVQVQKHKQIFSKEKQFIQNERNLIKSKSNNNLQYAQSPQHEEQEEKNIDAKQSYEHWQKIINKKIICRQKNKINRSSERSNTPTSSANPVQGKVFQILNNIPNTPTNQKKSFVQNSIGSNSSISPRVLNKNKSATQLNIIPTNSMTNFNLQQAQQQQQLSTHQKLYIQGIEQMERKRHIYEENQERSKEREMEGSTFHPRISPQSRNLKLQDGVKLEDYLILEGRKNKERRAIASLVKDEENNQECRFKPQVSITSQKLAQHQQSQNDSNFSSIHERLYFQGLSDIANKEEWSSQQFQNNHPFNPDLGINKDRKISERTQKEFINRLISENQVKEAKILALRQKENLFIDKQTGQTYFQPKISKDEVYQKVSKRVYLQDKQLEEKMKSRSTSPLNNMNHKQRREVISPRAGQFKWEEVLRSNRDKDYNENKRQNSNSNRRSVTPRNNNTIAEEFEESNYVPLSSRFANSKQKTERILDLSQLMNKQSIIQQSKNKEKQNNVPIIDLSKKYVSTETSNYHASMVNLTKIKKSSKIITQNNKYVIQNDSNFSNGIKSKSQLQLNKSLNQISAIAKPDNSKLLNDNKLLERIVNIFDQFDSDEDDKIDAFNIDISTTDSGVIEIIQNVLFEIDGKNLTLNRNQFIDLLCQHNLIMPLKRYFDLQEGEVEQNFNDYDNIRQNMSGFNHSNLSYLDTSSINTQSTQNKSTLSSKQALYQNQSQDNPKIILKNMFNNSQNNQLNNMNNSYKTYSKN